MLSSREPSWLPELPSSPRHPPWGTPQNKPRIWYVIPSRRRPWYGAIVFLSAAGPPVGSSSPTRTSSTSPPANTSISTSPAPARDPRLISPLPLKEVPILPLHHVCNFVGVRDLDTIDLGPHRHSFVIGYQHSLLRVVGGSRVLSRRVEFVKDTVEDRLNPLRGSHNEWSGRGEGAGTTNAVAAMATTVSVRVTIVVAIRVAVVPRRRGRWHCRHGDLGVLELCTLVPFRKHLGRRLDANTADRLAAGARLAAVEVANRFT